MLAVSVEVDSQETSREAATVVASEVTVELEMLQGTSYPDSSSNREQAALREDKAATMSAMMLCSKCHQEEAARQSRLVTPTTSRRQVLA